MYRYHRFTFSILAMMLILLTVGCTTVDGELWSLESSNDSVEAIQREAHVLPPAVEYDLGETTIVQSRFPEGDRFRHMPVRLNGVIGVPTGEGGPYPVVIILHGTHPGCPVDENGHVDRWPCAPEVEQPNYRGFAYLAQALAAEGYVVLSPNINAENTFGFGEPEVGERLKQLLDAHLRALSTDASGETNKFGVDLEGRVDLSRLVILGHSRGGDAAIQFAHTLVSEGEDNPDNERPYGVVNGLLLIAPSPIFVDPAEGVPAPMAVVLPACDADVVNQDGQVFYEALRLLDSPEWATSVWLERANHNGFNSILPGDPFVRQGRPDCENLLEPTRQRDFLAAYASDFLTTLFSRDPAQVRSAMLRMGIIVDEPAVDQLYGLAAQATLLSDVRHRLPLLTPASVDNLTVTPFDSAITVEGVETLFCPEGYYTPFTHPELADCHRANVTVPGQPVHAVVRWEAAGGEISFALPVGLDNLLLFDAISVRTVVDPISTLNESGAAQGFSIRLTDREGNRASVKVRDDEPALRFPAGELVEDELFDRPLFSGIAPLMPVRIPLNQFDGVNLASVSEISIILDQTDSGTLFLADLELVRAPVSSRVTLGDPPSTDKIAAAEAGDVEAMRQLANSFKPTEVLGVWYGDLEQTVYWYRRACAAGYANAQVDFYRFAREHAEQDNGALLQEALVCLDAAIRQGHQSAIIFGAFHAAYIDEDYATAVFLHALLHEEDPVWAAERDSFSEHLTQEEVDAAEDAARQWLSENQIKDYEDFFAEVSSPFRQP